MSNAGVLSTYGVRANYGVLPDEGVRPNYGIGAGDILVSVLYSTLTSPATELLINGAGIAVTFNARDVNNVVVVGYTPVPSSGVI